MSSIFIRSLGVGLRTRQIELDALGGEREPPALRVDFEDLDAQLVTGLYTYLDCAAARLGPRTYLTPSLSNIYSWSSPSYQNNTSRAELRLDPGPLRDAPGCFHELVADRMAEGLARL